MSKRLLVFLAAILIMAIMSTIAALKPFDGIPPEAPYVVFIVLALAVTFYVIYKLESARRQSHKNDIGR
jgi:hypothetical protein